MEELPEDLPPIVVNDTDDPKSQEQQPLESDMPHHPVAANIEFPKEKKWLAPMTWTDLYAIYELKIQDGDDKASWPTFRHQWVFKWKKVLGIRRVGQHARCSECARLDKALRTCQDKTKKDMLVAERQEHLRSMLADRDLERRLITMSENSCSGQCKEPGKMEIDGKNGK